MNKIEPISGVSIADKQQTPNDQNNKKNKNKNKQKNKEISFQDILQKEYEKQNLLDYKI